VTAGVHLNETDAHGLGPDHLDAGIFSSFSA